MLSEQRNRNIAEDKKKTLPTELRCVAKYDFCTSSIVLCFSDDHWDWNCVSISGEYKSPVKDVVIEENLFKLIEDEEYEEDYVYNYNFDEQKFTQIFKLSIAKIERCVVAKRFSVKFGYMFHADPNNQHFSTEYFFDVSFCTQMMNIDQIF